MSREEMLETGLYNFHSTILIRPNINHVIIRTGLIAAYILLPKMSTSLKYKR
jgi:hypothetical protein